MGLGKDFKQMLSDGGKISSKRTITFIAFILVCIAFIANIGWGIIMGSTILHGMINIVFGGLGVTVGEHLLRKRHGGERFDDYGDNEYGDNGYDDNYGGHDQHGGHGGYGGHGGHGNSSPDVNVHVHTELGDN